MAPIVLVIIDGLGDVTTPTLASTLPPLESRSPLEVAYTPLLDALARAGLTGVYDPVEPGLACGSDTAHLSIFGYDPRSCYRGRGAFESMGAGLHMNVGDIAFKCNFATMDPDTKVVLHRRADRHFEHLGPTLCQALDGLTLPNFPHHSIHVQYATEHRCGLVVRGPNLSDAIEGTDPLRDQLALRTAVPLDASDANAVLTASLVNELHVEMHRILAQHPINLDRIRNNVNQANVVLLRGCGSRIKVPPFQEKYNLRAAMIAPTKIIAGLGMSLGMEVVDVPGATGDYRTDLAAKARAAADTLHHVDMVVLHIKAVDDAAHDRNVPLRIKLLECVDAMLAQLVKRLDNQQTILAVIGDHSTPVLFGDHSHEPVPVAMARVNHVVARFVRDGLVGEEALDRVPLESIPLPPTTVELDSPPLQHPPLQQPLAIPEPLWDATTIFSERTCAGGSLGRFVGADLMPLLLNLAQWKDIAL